MGKVREIWNWSKRMTVNWKAEVSIGTIIQIGLLLFGIAGGYVTIKVQHDFTRETLTQQVSELKILREYVQKEFVLDKVYQAERAAMILELSKLNNNQKETTDAVNALRIEMARNRAAATNPRRD